MTIETWLHLHAARSRASTPKNLTRSNGLLRGRTMTRYQLHLSTLISLMLFASVMLWLNIQPRVQGDRTFVGLLESTPYIGYMGRGWPSAFELWLELPGRKRYEFDSFTLVLNVAWCLLLLFLAALVIEWVTRRVATRARSAPARAANEDHRN